MTSFNISIKVDADTGKSKFVTTFWPTRKMGYTYVKIKNDPDYVFKIGSSITRVKLPCWHKKFVDPFEYASDSDDFDPVKYQGDQTDDCSSDEDYDTDLAFDSDSD